MKRDRDRGKTAAAAGGSGGSPTGKAKMRAEQQPDAGTDELFAVLGYEVKSSDMADVAEKLEQLEMAMVSTTEDGASVLSNDTVHYNPSDLSGWVDSMLSELSSSTLDQIGAAGEPCPDERGERKFAYDDDLRAIPGAAIFSSKSNGVAGNDDDDPESRNKRMKFPEDDSSDTAARPVVVVEDSQEAGVRLVHALMACAEAVQRDNTELADALVKHVGILAVSQVGAMRKVATYFAEALARKIYRISPPDESSYADALQMHFYETGPYLKFAHFTANQAILEAVSGASRVHVVDFGLKQGMQWPALLQALALRPGGPPSFRLTGIGPPQPENNNALQEAGSKLAQLAKTIGVEFEFHGLMATCLADLDASILDIRPGDDEAVAVNSVFELHRLLSRPGAIERVFDLIREMRPKIVTIVEQEGNHNGSVFLDRFNEALHYYSTVFDSLEGSGLTPHDGRDLAMTEVYLGRQICNVVACEGAERVERHETLAQWRRRMGAAGFRPVHLGSNAFKQASMLLELFAGGGGFRVEENGGCLMLGWQGRPLIATSAWRPAAGE